MVNKYKWEGSAKNKFKKRLRAAENFTDVYLAEKCSDKIITLAIYKTTN